MSEVIQKGKWVCKESSGDYLWYYESTCKKCGVPVFIPLDSARLQTLLCATCYSEAQTSKPKPIGETT